MSPTSAGVEPATSWSPVGRRIQHSHRGQLKAEKYFFLFLHVNIHCGYSLEVPHWGTSNEYPQCMFVVYEIRKKSEGILLSVAMKDSGQPVHLYSLLQLCWALWLTKNPRPLQTNPEAFDQTVQMCRQILDLIGCLSYISSPCHSFSASFWITNR